MTHNGRRSIAIGAISAVATFCVVLAFGLLLGSESRFATGQSISTDKPDPCCIRRNGNPDLASAELQQAVASAIVESGGTIQNMRAVRPEGDARVRRIILDVAYNGSEENVVRALVRMGSLSPRVGLARAKVDLHGPADTTMTVRIVQWVRLTRGSTS